MFKKSDPSHHNQLTFSYLSSQMISGAQLTLCWMFKYISQSYLYIKNIPSCVFTHRLMRRQMFIMERSGFSFLRAFFALMDYLVEFTGERIINHRCSDLSL